MQIIQFTLHAVRLPLRRTIRHASAERRSTDNLWVCCRLSDGTVGWGEGVPRSYVTGETIDGAFEQFNATNLAEQLNGSCDDWNGVLLVCQRLQLAAVREDPRKSYGNALRCAIELSVLDAYGKLFRQPVSAAIAQVPFAGALLKAPAAVRYSGAITAASAWRECLSAAGMRCYGFNACKIKVGMAGVDERRRLRRIRQIVGRRMDLRLDANEAWRADEAIGKIEPLLEQRISCVEQPVRHEEVGYLAELRKQLPVAVMLDESLTSVHDAEDAIRSQTCDFFNIRLSKCGGILNGLRLAAMAQEAGLGYQLGCHPGESPLLSAAGRHWAACVRDIRYVEGSYDRHLLNERITRQDITFGFGGWAAVLDQPGLGVDLLEPMLRRMSYREHVARLDAS